MTAPFRDYDWGSRQAKLRESLQIVRRAKLQIGKGVKLEHGLFTD